MSVRAEIADGRRIGTWNRDKILQSLRDYAELYGDEYTTAAFNPSVAKWRDELYLVERYYAGNSRRGGEPWPSLNSIKTFFNGSFNEARIAAGLAPNTPGPSPGRPSRPAGVHAPIRDVVEHRVMERSERSVMLSRALRLSEERVARAVARAERAEARLADVKPVVRERVRHVAPTVKTVTKTVKVRDERAVDRVRARLADSEASHRATKEQLRAAVRDRDRAVTAAEQDAVRLADAVADATEARRAQMAMTDAMAAAKSRVERLRDERDAALAVESDARERALAADFVRAAEVKVEQAEVRAAKAERVALEYGAAVTGTMRMLSKAELADVRRTGPAGPVVLAGALKKLARARREAGDLDTALVLVARAALAWRERL